MQYVASQSQDIAAYLNVKTTDANGEVWNSNLHLYTNGTRHMSGTQNGSDKRRSKT